MDAREYQELKQRTRKKARGARRAAFITSVLAGLIVFILGLTGGLLVSATRVAKTGRGAGSSILLGSGTRLPTADQDAKNMPVHEVKQPPKPEAGTGKKNASANRPPSVRKQKVSYPPVRTKEARRPARVTLRVSPHFPRIRNDGKTEETMAYASRVQSLIELNKVDSVKVAKRPTAPCTVVCILKRDGSIKHAEVVKSSGDAVLDAAALRSVTNARRFPAVPTSIQGEEVSFDLPVGFRKSR